MKAAIFEVEEWEKPFFEEAFGKENLLFFHEHLTPEHLPSLVEIDILCVFIYSEVTKEIITSLPNLKLIATRSTGFDHIDATACKEKKITLVNVPEYGTHSVAEHTFALLLSMTRNIVPSVEETRIGSFDLTNLSGMDIFGKTIGLLGFGNIGKHVAQIARGFGMKIIVYTRHPDPEDSEVYGVKFAEMDEVLKKSDILSLHLPYTKETHHLLTYDKLTLMKKGSILINTARGALIDTEGLVKAIDEGILAKVGLDVIEEECNIKEERQLLSKNFLASCDLKTQVLNHVLLSKENVFITPHNAFNSTQSLHKILKVTIENIHAFLQKRPSNTISL